MVHPLISVSIEQCSLAVSDRTSSLISVCTEVPGVDVCPCRWYESNDLNRVWNKMGSDPIQSHECVISPLSFFCIISSIDKAINTLKAFCTL